MQPVTFRPVQRIVGVVGTLHGYEEIKLKAKVAGRVREKFCTIRPIGHVGRAIAGSGSHGLPIECAHRLKSRCSSSWPSWGLPSRRRETGRNPNSDRAAGQLKCENARTRLDRAEKLIARKAGTDEELSDKTSEYRVARAEYDNQVLLAAPASRRFRSSRKPWPSRSNSFKTGADQSAGSQPADSGGREWRALRDHWPFGVGRQLCDGRRRIVQTRDRAAAEISRPSAGTQERRSSLGATGRGLYGRVSAAIPWRSDADQSFDRSPTRTFEVEILVPNKQGELKPGAFAKTAILTGIDEHAPTVPLESLVHVAGVTKIFLVVDGRAKQVLVTLGVQGTEWVESFVARVARRGAGRH